MRRERNDNRAKHILGSTAKAGLEKVGFSNDETYMGFEAWDLSKSWN